MSVNPRDKHLINQRPEISSAKIVEATSSFEAFQNQVIRPILKFQNELLIEVFLSHIKTKNQDPSALSFTEKQEIIKAQFKTNTTLKQMLLGCVIGLLTTEEFNYYNANTSNINKRIFSMLKERLFDKLK
ncbi:MAG: glyoxalase [Bacteroidetes bacterium]|nr:glyoxalase [Bacteroidota bacterium]MDA0859530.1 glyoxalase [Bacteroidota bacterium]MDA1317884.1 glyoxalase [Bacteroidota bacterium]